MLEGVKELSHVVKAFLGVSLCEARRGLESGVRWSTRVGVKGGAHKSGEYDA